MPDRYGKTAAADRAADAYRRLALGDRISFGGSGPTEVALSAACTAQVRRRVHPVISCALWCWLVDCHGDWHVPSPGEAEVTDVSGGPCRRVGRTDGGRRTWGRHDVGWWGRRGLPEPRWSPGGA